MNEFVNMLRKLNPHLSRRSAQYIASVVLPVAQSDPDASPEEIALTANDIILRRLRSGHDVTRVAVTEDLMKYRPTYEAAVKVGEDPVVALAMAFPLGGKVAHQHVLMFQEIDG